MRLREIVRWLPLACGAVVLAVALARLPSAVRASRQLGRGAVDGGVPYARRFWFARVYFSYPPPGGRHGRSDLRDSVPRLTINVAPNGTYKFKGGVWHEDVADPRTTDDVRAAIYEELRLLIGRPDLKAADGSNRGPVMLAIGRDSACLHLLTLLDVLDEEDLRVVHVQWPICLVGQGDGFRQDARRLPHLPARDEGRAAVIHLTPSAEGYDVRIRVGEQMWSLTLRPDPAQCMEADDEVEAAWTAIGEAVRLAAGGGEAARIVVDTDALLLRWGHLARLLDTLVGAGIRRVSVPDWQLALELVPPPPRQIPTPRTGKAPLVSGVAWLACALAVLLAFAITFLPRTRAHDGSHPKRTRGL